MADISILKGLGEPAKALIERVFDMFGERAKPSQIPLIAEAEGKATLISAKAEAEAAIIKAHNQVAVDKILALGEIEGTEEKRRAVRGLVHQEERNQRNRDNILRLAAPEIREDAKPEAIEEDWLLDFFDKSRLVSDKDMQLLWGRVLAGEANEPGTFSKRTVNLLQVLSKKEANYFQSLSRFDIGRPENPRVLIFSLTNSVYAGAGVSLHAVTELQALGLVSWRDDYFFVNFGEVAVVTDYFGKRFAAFHPEIACDEFPVGHVAYTDIGKELARLCTPEPVPGFAEYLVAKWQEFGYTVEELPPAEN